jgi:hypothetical protein
MTRTLGSGPARYFAKLIVACNVPAYEVRMNLNGVGVRVIALRIRDIDGFPWRQYEDLVVEAMSVQEACNSAAGRPRALLRWAPLRLGRKRPSRPLAGAARTFVSLDEESPVPRQAVLAEATSL